MATPRGREIGRVGPRQDRPLKLTFGGSVNSETLTADKVFDLATDPHYQLLDPGGAARDLDMPAEETSAGYWFEITNAADAAENLVVKNDADGTVCTIGQSQAAKIVCDGAAWHCLGIVTLDSLV